MAKTKRLLSAIVVVLVAALVGAPDASARSGILSDWQDAYPGSSADDADCQLCHRDANGGNPFNAYGWDMRENEGLGYPDAFFAIEDLDSDLDPTGSTNLDEIMADVQPGWTDGANNTIFYKNGSTDTNQSPPVELAALLLDPSLAHCDDGIDNDGDGTIDFAGGPGGEDPDPGCASANDPDGSERSASLPCDDGVDNDSDGSTDFDPVTFADPGDQNTDPAGFGDPGCKTPTFSLEDPLCQNGVDDPDGDVLLDYDAGRSANGTPDPAGPDPQCAGKPWRNNERSSSCGLGYELALGMTGLTWLRRRRFTSR